MTAIEDDIRSAPDTLRHTVRRVEERRASLAALIEGPVVMLGSGSSYCVAAAAAALFEEERARPAQAFIASDYRPRAGWAHVAISRTGQTTEVVEAMRGVHDSGGHVLLVTGEGGSPAERYADGTLLLDFAAEQGVIQTRFIVAAFTALRLLAGARMDPDLPARLSHALDRFDPTPLTRFDHAVFLGRGWRYGLARAAALNLQETTLLSPEAHQTLDYRHGPIAATDEDTLVWCLDAPDDALSAAVLEDARRTGALVVSLEQDPLISLAQAQLLALHKATTRGVDPSAPRHLTRAVILSR